MAVSHSVFSPLFFVSLLFILFYYSFLLCIHIFPLFLQDMHIVKRIDYSVSLYTRWIQSVCTYTYTIIYFEYLFYLFISFSIGNASLYASTHAPTLYLPLSYSHSIFPSIILPFISHAGIETVQKRLFQWECHILDRKQWISIRNSWKQLQQQTKNELQSKNKSFFA